MLNLMLKPLPALRVRTSLVCSRSKLSQPLGLPRPQFSLLSSRARLYTLSYVECRHVPSGFPREPVVVIDLPIVSSGCQPVTAVKDADPTASTSIGTGTGTLTTIAAASGAHGTSIASTSTTSSMVGISVAGTSCA